MVPATLDLFTDHQVYERTDVVTSVLSHTPPVVLRYMAGAQKTFVEGHSGARQHTLLTYTGTLQDAH